MKGLMTLVSALSVFSLASTCLAVVKPGDEITPENAALVQDLVTPGNFVLVKQGMRMKIVPTERLEWPPPYKSATEKYSPQVRLSDKGELQNYVAGLPFPLVDPNDPQVASRVVWNYSYRPMATDDLDIRGVETVSNRDRDEIPGQPVQRAVTGHVAVYNNVGRTEVQPFPTDPEAKVTGIRYRYGAFPVLEPATVRGWGFLRFRYLDPNMEDNLWVYNPGARRVARSRADTSSGAKGAATIDPDSSFGFAAKIEDFDYRLLGIKPMLAVAHAAALPAPACEFDNQDGVSRGLGDASALYRGGDGEAARLASADRNRRSRHPQAYSLHRFGRLVHRRFRSVRQGRRVVENARYLLGLSGSLRARRQSCDLPLPANL